MQLAALFNLFVRMSASERALLKYGVGACGPRGFFGTFDAHLELERALTARHASGASIVYASAYLATLSLVGALRGARVYGPEDVHTAVRDGCVLARAHYTALPTGTCRIENSDDVWLVAASAANAREILASATVRGRKWRLLCVCDAQDVLALGERDARVGSLGAWGGYASGPRSMVDAQRLQGVGYCFSAALPPFMCEAARAALR